MVNKTTISLKDTKISHLEELSQIRKYYLRCKIILLANLGYEPREIAPQLNCSICTVWDQIRKLKKSGFEGLYIKLDKKNTPEVLKCRIDTGSG
ncbi:MAG: helix-turn-helix domain-containing protein [Candidatus Heimdallarchaeota archaeon]|nr:helix-turn-helix domain-containing protein [Candidatus Heimdallarchaeota archaeon]